MEGVLCVAYFCIGCWEIQTGLKNPTYVGWVEGGAVYVLGAPLCLWLGWRRRQVDNNGILFYLLLPQVARILSEGLKWRAGEPRAEWPWDSCLLAAVILAMIVWEIRVLRKDALRASV